MSDEQANHSNDDFTDAELEAFLEESLDPARASEIEQTARNSPGLLKRLAALNRRRDHGAHSLAGIWRRYQIGVPSREEMGQYLLGILDAERVDYIKFRLECLKCPFTQSLLMELQQATDRALISRNRTQRDSIFQSGTQILSKNSD